MKILMINHFPLTGSGSGVYTLNIAKSLVRKGHQVAIIAPENMTVHEKIDGIQFYPVYFKDEEIIENQLPFNFPCFTTHPRSVKSFNDLTNQELTMYMQLFKTNIDSVIKDFTPDIIHGGHIWLLNSLVTDYDIPLIVTAHGTDLIGYQENEKYRVYADKVALNASKIITISRDNQELVNKIFPNYQSKTVNLTNGYDANIFNSGNYNKKEVLNNLGLDNYQKVVVFAGKLTNIKGIDTLISAATIYENSDTLTIIAGNGELFDFLYKLTNDYNLKNVKFIGNQPQNMLNKLFNIADVSVIPSRYEAFGLVAIEALACGTPIIASNIGGLVDIVNEKVGLLFEVGNSNDLANKIIKVLNKDIVFDQDVIITETCKKYSQDSLIDELIDIYNDVIKERGNYVRN